ncbi:antioxidant, putative [Vibrio cholerae]|nr:antioxidant, putative [Vibrio cholerae]
MIQIGQTLPDVQLSQRTSEGTLTHSVTTLFANKKVVLFAVPGAFTPTCSEAHLPGSRNGHR